MYYIVYKTTCNVNGKIYIGIHKQDIDPYIFDGYLGSGVLLSRAVEKYGSDKFSRETLFVYDTLNESRDKERELVTHDFCTRNDTYNISVGGTGGNTTAGYTPEQLKLKSEKQSKSHKEWFTTSDGQAHKEFLRKRMKVIRVQPNNKGRKHSDEYRKRVAEHNKLFKYYTNGTDNRKLREGETVPDGYTRGRTLTTKFTGHSDKVLASMSEKRTGGSYYNKDGVNRYFRKDETVPDGYIHGMVKNKNRSVWLWYTNGTDNVKLLKGTEPPIDMWSGRTMKKRSNTKND